MNSTTHHHRSWTDSVASDYRVAGNAELLSEIESLEYDLAEAGQFGPTAAEVVRFLCGGRLKLAEAELARRVTLCAAGGNVPNPNAASYAAWRDLARDVRERADMLDLFATAGVPLQRDGKEHSGPCPLCGGNDRFRVWTAEDGKRPGYWCRKCGISGDAIAAYRAFLVPGASFFDAARILALQLGMRTPDHGTAKNGSQTIVPLGKAAFGNKVRPPSIRFENGRAVAS